jgi:hypothetical protein
MRAAVIALIIAREVNRPREMQAKKRRFLTNLLSLLFACVP